jgi:hypothetical protein
MEINQTHICENPNCNKSFTDGRDKRHDHYYCCRLCANIGVGLILKQNAEEQRKLKEIEYLKNPKLCPQCNEIISYAKRENKYCSAKCSAKMSHIKRKESGWSLSQESRNILSIKAKNNLVGCANINNIESREKSRITMAKKKAERLEKLKQILVCQDKECNKEFISYGPKKFCCKECYNKNKYHPNSTRNTRAFYNDVQMDSGAEVVFAKLLDNENIQWIKNTEISFNYDPNNFNKRYYPDFFLPQFKMWVEIKGKRYIRPDDEIRRAAVPGGVYLIISNNFKTELPVFLNYIKTLSLKMVPDSGTAPH